MAILQRLKLRSTTAAGVATPTTAQRSNADEIARVAYDLYARRGYTHGRDVDDWLEAERLVATRRAGEKLRAR